MARIPRVTMVPFGNNAGAVPGGIGVFGSLAAGTPTESINIATIMAASAWSNGWGSALVNLFPAQEDLNSPDFVHSQQIAEILQDGIPPYDSGTTYFKNSFCQSGGQIYISLTDSNTGNTPVSSSSNWQLYASSTAKGENLFRNAGLQIAQRGASGTVTAGSPAYTLDGWIVGGSTHNVGWSQQLGALGDGTPGLNLTPSGGTPTAAFIKQRIESLVMDGIPLTGFITVQCQITNLSGSSITPTLVINYANAQDNFSAVTSFLAATNLQVCPNSQTTTVSYTFQANINLFTGMEIIFGFGSGIVSTGITFNLPDCSYTPYLQVVGLQSNPPLAQIRPIGVEIPNCQRYFQNYGPSGNTAEPVIGVGYMSSSSQAHFQLSYPAMRSNPAITFPVSGFFIQGFDGTAYSLSGGTITGFPGPAFALLLVTGASGFSAGTGGLLSWQNSSSGSYSLSSEL